MYDFVIMEIFQARNDLSANMLDFLDVVERIVLLYVIEKISAFHDLHNNMKFVQLSMWVELTLEVEVLHDVGVHEVLARAEFLVGTQHRQSDSCFVLVLA